MLLYRPILTAYRETSHPRVRRFLLRELSDPHLHAEPDELLREVSRGAPVSAADEPVRLAAEVSLEERALRLRLTTRDPERELGGLWTCQAAGRALVEWARARESAASLSSAAGRLLKPIATRLLSTSGGGARTALLAALGDLGSDVALNVLADELLSGRAPHAAVLGLVRLGTPAARETLVPAIQVRGLAATVPWLGVALGGLAGPETVPVFRRLMREGGEDGREHAARALEAYGEHDLDSLVELFGGESSAFVRLNVVSSLGRLSTPAGFDKLAGQLRPADPEMLRVAVVQAAGRSDQPRARALVELALLRGSPAEKAAALEAAVCQGLAGDVDLSEARTAAGSASERLVLAGLLALAVWSPEEAFQHVSRIFEESPSSRWFLATYALRYLRTDQTVPLLKRLCEVVRGTDLEEIAVSALSRHLSEPGVLEALLSCVRPGAAPAVIRRVLVDLARHLPGDRAFDAAEGLRQLLSSPEHADGLSTGPLLEALGALGSESDMATLVAHTRSAHAVSALTGIELLMDPATGSTLEELSGSPLAPVRDAAILASFRLGLPGCLESLAKLAQRPDTADAAARLVAGMARSVQCVTQVSRLSLLHAWLRTGAPPSGTPGEPDVKLAGRSAGQSRGDSGVDLEDVLSRLRPAVVGSRAPALPRASATDAGAGVYRQLGRHLLGKGMAPATPYVWLAVPALVAVSVVILVWRSASGVSIAPPAALHGGSRLRPAPAATPVAGPAAVLLTRPAPGGGSRPVVAGEQIVTDPAHPVTIATPVPRNVIVVLGTLQILALSDAPWSPRSLQLQARLMEGAVKLDLVRGETAVTIAAGSSTIQIYKGQIALELQGEDVSVRVYSGWIRTVVPPGAKPAVVSAGHRAVLRAGGLAAAERPFDPAGEAW